MKARSAAERRRLTKQLDAAVCHVSTSLVSHISVNQTAQPGIQMWGGREREGERERERESSVSSPYAGTHLPHLHLRLNATDENFA